VFRLLSDGGKEDREPGEVFVEIREPGRGVATRATMTHGKILVCNIKKTPASYSALVQQLIQAVGMPARCLGISM